MTIKKLQLTNFRLFKKKEIDFTKTWTILVAPNAMGKSSIIEALYMLSHGQSPWESNPNNVIRITDSKAKDNSLHEKIAQGSGRIEGLIDSKDEPVSMALFFKTNGRSTTKQFQVEGVGTSREVFLEHFHCVLFSPDMIDLLMFEPAQRRSFLDTHASPIHPGYDETIRNYHKVLKQRNSLLRILCSRRRFNSSPQRTPPSNNSMKYWTEQLLELGSEIISTRLEFIHAVNEASNLYPATITYKPSVSLHELSDLADPSFVRDTFEEQLLEVKSKELAFGTTLLGPHRDDWFLTLDKRNLNSFGSRGEKRIAIADIILKLNTLLQETYDNVPVLLLDDITSELDEKNVGILFKKKLSPKQQIIITTTDLSSIPKEAQKISQIIEL